MNLEKAYNKDAMRNPESMDFFIKMRDEKGFEIQGFAYLGNIIETKSKVVSINDKKAISLIRD